MRNLQLELNGTEYGYSKINSDTYGNPRIVVHFLSIGLDDYDTVSGLTKYRGKQFGGGYVMQSYHDGEAVAYALQMAWNHNIKIIEKAVKNLNTTTDILKAARNVLEVAETVTTREGHAALWDLKVDVLRAANDALETGGFDGSAYHELQKAKHLLNAAETVAGEAARKAYAAAGVTL